MSRNKMASWGLLLAVFVANGLETQLEALANGGGGVVPELGYRLAHTFRQVEGIAVFDGHEASNAVAVYGYSLSYFFVLPLIAISLASALSRRPEDGPLRVLARALAIDYAVSLPFFLFFPVPERWAFPDSGAMLLSDRWSSALVAAIRPISGLDNCFPSFHVSMAVVLAGVAFATAVKMRFTLAFLGATVVVSTFGLGIHWLPDIVGGAAVGVLAVALALRFERAPSRLAPASLRAHGA